MICEKPVDVNKFFFHFIQCCNALSRDPQTWGRDGQSVNTRHKLAYHFLLALRFLPNLRSEADLKSTLVYVFPIKRHQMFI